jgi:hypothetical protein
MSDDDSRARARYFSMAGVRIAAVAGALLGLVLIGRATTWPPKILGTAIILSALFVMATVPQGMARRWRTPPDA